MAALDTLIQSAKNRVLSTANKLFSSAKSYNPITTFQSNVNQIKNVANTISQSPISVGLQKFGQIQPTQASSIIQKYEPTYNKIKSGITTFQEHVANTPIGPPITPKMMMNVPFQNLGQQISDLTQPKKAPFPTFLQQPNIGEAFVNSNPIFQAPGLVAQAGRFAGFQPTIPDTVNALLLVVGPTVGRELVKKFGSDLDSFIVNRKLIDDVTTGRGTPEQIANFKKLNGTGLEAEGARSPNGISVSMDVPKTGKVWDFLRMIFPDNVKPTIEQKPTFQQNLLESKNTMSMVPIKQSTLAPIPMGLGRGSINPDTRLNLPNIEKQVQSKIQKLNQMDIANPIKEGNVRVYQTTGKGMSTDWAFKTPEELANYMNNSSGLRDEVRYLDVRPELLELQRNGTYKILQNEVNKLIPDVADEKLSDTQLIKKYISAKDFRNIAERYFPQVKEYYLDEGIATVDDYLKKMDTHTIDLEMSSNQAPTEAIVRLLGNNQRAWDIPISDIIDMYKKGKLIETISKPQFEVGKQEISNILAGPAKFYQTNVLSNADIRKIYQNAILRPTKQTQTIIMKSRKELYLYWASHPNAAQELGISVAELNKKIRTLIGSTLKSIETQRRVNEGVPEQFHWTGVTNSNWVSKNNIEYKDVDRVVNSIIDNSPNRSFGSPNGKELRKYIMNTFLSIDTRLLYDDLNFDVQTLTKALGQYSNRELTITISNGSDNTVSHEIGHYLDYRFSRELGMSNGSLSSGNINYEYLKEKYNLPDEQIEWSKKFKEFTDNLQTKGEIGYSANRATYLQTPTEVFARFVAKFVDWTSTQSRNYLMQHNYYQDTFDTSDYYSFIKLLQKKAEIDTKYNIRPLVKGSGEDINLSKPSPLSGGVTKEVIPPGKAKFKQPIKPPSPPTPEIPQGDPVQKIIQALKVAKPLERQQAGIYSKIRSQQAAKVAAMGSKVPGEAGYFAQLGQLKGEMPKVQFESIRKQIGQADIDSLFNLVEQSALTPFEKITAKTGLAKLLGAQGGQVPVRSELQVLQEVFPPEFIQAVLNRRSTMEKLFSLGENVLNLPRAMMATADLSAPLRQGIFLSGRPKQWLPAFRDMFKYAFSEKSYQDAIQQTRSNPLYPLMKESKLALTDMGPVLSSREEAFMSNLSEKIPIFGTIARGSNRAYSGFLNKLRVDTFSDLVRSAQNLGLDIKEVAPDIAKFVNSATGRGDLGMFQKAAPVLNGLLFSPRLLASRLNLLNPLYYAKLNPFVRKEALKSLFTFLTLGMTVLGLAKLAGAEVGTDPRSADFGKIKIGNTRFDIWGGFQQYMVLAARLITNQMVSSTTGKEFTLGTGYKPTTRFDIVQRFFESKESPVASFISSILRGQTSMGEKVNIPAQLVDMTIPIMVQDMSDLYKERGLPGLAMAIPGVFGVGSQTYTDQVPMAGKTATGKPNVQWRSAPGLGEQIINKVTGTELSNIPQDQWQSLIDKRKVESQWNIDYSAAKAKVLDSGTATTIDNPITQKKILIYLDKGVVKTKDITPKTSSTKSKALPKPTFPAVKKIKSVKKVTLKKPKKIKLAKLKSIKLPKVKKVAKVKINIKPLLRG